MTNLETPLEQIQSIGPRFANKLKKLGLKTFKDLLWHFPTRYEDFSEIYKIADLAPRQEATIRGEITEINGRRAWRRRLHITEALISDESDTIRAVWFNQPYIKDILVPGREANFSGKVSVSKDNEIYFSNPAYELLQPRTNADLTQTDAENFPRSSASNSATFRETRHTARVVPIYPETKGLTSRGLRYLIQPILKILPNLPETIAEEILKKENLPEIKTALKQIHFPTSIEAALRAKKRFAFEDLFTLQLLNIRERLKLAREKAPPLKTEIENVKRILGRLPFTLTPSQKKSLWEIIQDLEKSHPMNRLLQGDVGSGKTIIAAVAAILVAENNYQTAFMAPTEILARQHFNTFLKFFPEFGSGVALLTSSEAEFFYGEELRTKTKKLSLIKEIAEGKIAVVFGTHALIQKNIAFRNLGLVIVDEQHRFGVKQRQALLRGQTRTETPTDAENKLLFENTTFNIRNCLFEVRKNLGLGHKEVIYQKALEIEFKKSGVEFEREKSISVIYEGEKIGYYRPDFVINNTIILELKSLPFIGNIEKKQLWNYLKGSNYKLALLANFGREKLTIERVIYDTARKNQRLSASSPRLSASVPHLLSMSATPIPRTLNLTIFGDLDLSLITELPKNRKPIITKAVVPENRAKAYAFIRGQIKKGRQAFVICPRIEITNGHESATNITNTKNISEISEKFVQIRDVKTVTQEYEKLSKKIFPDLKVAMLHGKLKAKEKEKIMSDFSTNKINVLVATSVVEVGVDIPNATIMMIEGSERFGLAQLYQFRGRVGRGEHQSFCFLFSDSESQSTERRLKSIVEAKNGMELAEHDLKIRGPGEFFGVSQTGLPDLAMKAIQNPELVKTAREAAVAIIKTDPILKNHPALLEKINEFKKEIHWE